MTQERWRQIEEIYHSVARLPIGQRPRFVIEACHGDSALQEEVESLLQADEQAGNFLGPERMHAHLGELAVAEILPHPGSLLGRYQILSRLGSGAMGEVFLAADTILDRRVALKILPPRIIGDDQRLPRFVREAKAASALNHPNIITIHEIGEAGGIPFIATEYIQGETLRTKLARGPIPAAEVVEIACQCASALRAAHGAGIMHRDVKPENIMLRPDGLVKILDFGLARAAVSRETGTSAAAESQDPGVTIRGALVGTPRYMSPEQARGEVVDARTDIFSLGAVIYEMLAGEPPFRGATNAAIFENLLGKDPPFAAIPPKLNGVLRKMLAKRRDLRYQTMEEASGAIERLRQAPQRPAVRMAALAATVIAGVILGLGIYQAIAALSHRSTRPPLTVPIVTAPGEKDQVAFSPDSRQIAFSWNGGKNPSTHIYVKTVGDAEPVQLTWGSEYDRLPAWSPDGRYIAFDRGIYTREEIWVVPVAGGAARKIATGGVGVAWSPNGRELAFPDFEPPAASGGILVLDMQTGKRRQVTSAAPYSDGLPVFSPDGKYIAFDRSFTYSARELMVAPASGGPTRQLTFDKQAIYGQTWTADGRELVFDSVRYGGNALWRISASGGTPVRVETTAQSPTYPAMSRRGDRLAYTETFVDSNIYRLEGPGFEGAAAPHMLASPACLICSSREDDSPQISPDGKQIVFVSRRTGSDQIWTANYDGRKAVQMTFYNGIPTGSPRWSFDGKWIAYDSRGEGQPDIYVLSAAGGAPRRVTSGTAAHVMPAWSHDGKWIYFTSRVEGNWQIFKIPFAGGEAVQVTRHGGLDGYESPDGTLFYYQKRSGGLWSVPVDGGPERTVPALAKMLSTRSWGVAAEGIYFVDTGASAPTIRFYSFQTKRVTTLAAFTGDVLVLTPGLSLASDGKSMLLAKVDHRVNDLMMIEDFR